MTLHERAHEVAKTTGHIVTFGVRPHNGTIFASCNNIEHDGSTFEEALESVVRVLVDKANKEVAQAKRIMKESEKITSLLD